MGTLKINLKDFLLTVGVIILITGFVWVVGNQPLLNQQLTNAPENLQSTKRVCVTAPAQSTFVNQPGQKAPTPTILSSTNSTESSPIPASLGLPYAVTKITDMNTNALDKDKTYIYILHCGGSIELFKVVSSGSIDKDISLLPDDVVLDWIPPASLMGSRPPKSVATRSANTPTPFSVGYPPPVTPTLTPTRMPYP